MNRLTGIGFCCLVIICTGCTHMLAERMVAPPNCGLVDDGAGGMAGAKRINVAVGPPKARMAAWVMEPAKDMPVRGTILVLHGILANHDFVKQTAKALAAAGYRAVLIDLRGHGDSTGEHITYGVVESADLSQVTDYLQVNHLAGEKIGVFGISYGASTAIDFAGRDKRVAAVVALAPFSSLEEEAPHFGRTLLPMPGWFLSDQDYVDILAEAGKIAGFDPAAASPLLAITKTQAQVLLIHGDLDAITPETNSERLHAAAPGHSELHVLPGVGHIIVAMEILPGVEQMTCAWFEKHLAPPAKQAAGL